MRRIRNILRYMVVIILNIFVMVVFHSYINFILLVGLILLPFCSIFGLYQVKQMFSLQIRAPEEAMERGNEFYLHFVLSNPTWFPLVNATMRLYMENGFYGDFGQHYLNIPVRARKKTETVYPVVMDYCGRLKVKVEEIRLMDLLGIYEVSVPLQTERECMVFPRGQERNQEAGRIYMRGVSEAMESREKGYDFSEVSGIREYIPGDKLQNIHWKLSVKKDELMVKERISVSAMQLNVLLELANDEEMRLEAVLELADSITRSFVRQNLPFTIYYYSTGRGELRECYIGSEIERSQWMEMLLYDRCYEGFGRVEEYFLRENPSVHSYLYIGYLPEGEPEEDKVLFGEKQAAAVLRG
ncbi:MAG: DUF58 domain-containing protein [Bacteroidales bacterium]|nr:DUF58 domain-containing protein [Clostridium sp.]MCM1204183.1 DUF58 domain-containing protein [Bacteroidales bacterium]